METRNKILLNYEQLIKIQQWALKNKELVENNFYPFLLNGEIIIENMCFGKESDLKDYVDEEFINKIGEKEIKELFNNFIVTVNLKFNIKCFENNIYTITLGMTDDAKHDYDLTSVMYIYKDNKFLIKNYDMWLSNHVVEQNGQLATDINKKFPIVILEMYRDINAYFFHYKQDLSTVEQKTVERKTIRNKNKYHYNTIHYLDKSYTIKNKIKNNKISKTHQWHIDSWGVCGHLRHYSNGKVVFIKPYVKGKNRANIQEKTYKINKED